MELFVNFCEDTIFEMQLAAQMSDAGERLAMKEDGEREKSEEDSADAGFFSMSTVCMALLALRYNILLLIKVGHQSAARLTQSEPLNVVRFSGFVESFCDFFLFFFFPKWIYCVHGLYQEAC